MLGLAAGANLLCAGGEDVSDCNAWTSTGKLYRQTVPPAIQAYDSSPRRSGSAHLFWVSYPLCYPERVRTPISVSGWAR